jgi:DNA modification methylase
LIEAAYSTELGVAYVGDSREVLPQACAPGTVNLIVTSPPFALLSPKEYGNESQDEYLDWLLTFKDMWWDLLTDSGSLVIDIGGSWLKGVPCKSTIPYEVLIRFTQGDKRFFLAQDFFWHNTAKLPGPAPWVTLKRVRASDAVNTVWWLSKTEHPKANNRQVLRPYKDGMKRLLKTGNYNRGERPSGHRVGEGFAKSNGGSIPSNMLQFGNTSSDRKYTNYLKTHGLPIHPARFPPALPEFFIRFLTEPGDLVVDPFGGSNVTGFVAETLERRWASCELDPTYVDVSRHRFEMLEIS